MREEEAVTDERRDKWREKEGKGGSTYSKRGCGRNEHMEIEVR